TNVFHTARTRASHNHRAPVAPVDRGGCHKAFETRMHLCRSLRAGQTQSWHRSSSDHGWRCRDRCRSAATTASPAHSCHRHLSCRDKRPKPARRKRLYTTVCGREGSKARAHPPSFDTDKTEEQSRHHSVQTPIS